MYRVLTLIKKVKPPIYAAQGCFSLKYRMLFLHVLEKRILVDHY